MNREYITQEIEDLEKKYNLLIKTEKFLCAANENIKSKYVKPMNESISKYLNLVTENEFTKFVIDTDFKFNGIEKGNFVDLEYYSKGYKEIVSLCLRLSLIECLYKSELPVIILDDPFSNLDDRKLKCVKKLIKEISEKYQILYFTCHESRNLE